MRIFPVYGCMTQRDTYLRHKPLGPHPVSPYQLWCVHIPHKGRGKSFRPVSRQHVQEALGEERPQEALLGKGSKTRACQPALLREVCDLDQRLAQRKLTGLMTEKVLLIPQQGTLLPPRNSQVHANMLFFLAFCTLFRPSMLDFRAEGHSAQPFIYCRFTDLHGSLQMGM